MRFLLRQSSPSRTKGATLVEVMIASMVLGLVVASTIMVLRSGVVMIETTRDNTLTGQVLQSEMENLRLMNWEAISQLTDGPFGADDVFFHAPGTARFTFTRTIQDHSPTMRQITLEAEWTALNGVSLSRRYTGFFSKRGLNDYYYRSFN